MLLSIDLTTHDAEALTELRTKADGVLWDEEQVNGTLTVEYDRP
ncbi:hypothetical protein ACFFQF_23530 [Haladaptatus pallidirubidus]|uniref:Uncharacterized protein n=1 Tax=Haladaptatus pallidirubidus TaxID=1008152 RepID=A0AAV3UN95_9EURY